MQQSYFYALAMLALALPVVFGRRLGRVKVVVLLGRCIRALAADIGGCFVADAVEHLREAGTDIEVVSPASFPHFWARVHNAGIIGNLRRQPWRAALVPPFMAAYAHAARRAARDADLARALASSGLAAMATQPFVVQLLGDGRRARPPCAASRGRRPSQGGGGRVPLLGARRRKDGLAPGGSRSPRAASTSRSRSARRLACPRSSTRAGSPPEKGVLELVEAAGDLNFAVAGDAIAPRAGADGAGIRHVGEPPPSTRKRRSSPALAPRGPGVAALEAMAHGRPGGRWCGRRAARPGRQRRDGDFRGAGNVPALRAALERLLADVELRRRRARRAASGRPSTSAGPPSHARRSTSTHGYAERSPGAVALAPRPVARRACRSARDPRPGWRTHRRAPRRRSSGLKSCRLPRRTPPPRWSSSHLRAVAQTAPSRTSSVPAFSHGRRRSRRSGGSARSAGRP